MSHQLNILGKEYSFSPVSNEEWKSILDLNQFLEDYFVRRILTEEEFQYIIFHMFIPKSAIVTLFIAYHYYNDTAFDLVIQAYLVLEYLKRINSLFDIDVLRQLRNNITLIIRYQRDIIETIKDPAEKQFYSRLFQGYHILMIIPNTTDHYSPENFDQLRHPRDLRNFTYKFDVLINSQLRKNLVDSRTLKMIKNIIDDVANIENQEERELVLYRGVKEFEPVVGEIYQDFGFMSKSTQSDVSQAFMSGACCLLMFTTSNQNQIDMREVSAFPEEYEFLTFPNEIYQVDEFYNLYDSHKNKFTKVYHCIKVPHSQQEIRPVIDRRIDKILDDTELVVSRLLSSLKEKEYLILTSNFVSCVLPITSSFLHEIVIEADRIYYDSDITGSLIINNDSDTLQWQHEYLMKHLQLVVGLNIPFTLRILDVSNLTSDRYKIVTPAIDKEGDVLMFLGVLVENNDVELYLGNHQFQWHQIDQDHFILL